jgi:hypothetical protein
MPMFDPNQVPDINWQTQEAAISQQRKLAEMLRQKALQAKQPEGEMVGRGPGAQYVAPHWLEQLSPAIQQGIAGYYGGKADRAEQDFAKQQDQVGKQWRSSLPQSVPGKEGYGANEMDNEAVAPVAAQPITREAILKHTLAGLQNPATAKEAALVNQSLTSDLTRTEDKAFKDQEARTAAKERADNLVATLQQRQDALELQMQDRKLSREQANSLARMHDETLRAMSAATVDARKYAADAAHQQGLKDDSREFRTNVEHLSRRMEPHAPMINTAQQVQDMMDSYKDPKTGKVGNIPGVGLIVGSLPQGLLSTEGSTNRQKIQMFANAMLRAQAGLSQTLSEQQRADLELMAKGQFRQDQLLHAWPSLMEKVNSTTKNIKAGYEPRIIDAYSARNPEAMQLVGPKAKSASKIPVPSKGPTGGLTPAEEAELAALKAAQ